MVLLMTKIILNERGATAIEYGLIIAMIVLAMLAALSTFAEGAVGMWGNVANKVVNA
jgi:pilus assembly protein Flp/PilA